MAENTYDFSSVPGGKPYKNEVNGILHAEFARFIYFRSEGGASRQSDCNCVAFIVTECRTTAPCLDIFRCGNLIPTNAPNGNTKQMHPNAAGMQGIVG